MAREQAARTLLFDGRQDEEAVRIECFVAEDGCLHLVQVSSGPWSAWCFEDDPHRIETTAPRETTDALCAHFNLTGAQRLPVALQLVYAGIDAVHRIRELMASLQLDYEVRQGRDAPVATA